MASHAWDPFRYSKYSETKEVLPMKIWVTILMTAMLMGSIFLVSDAVMTNDRARTKECRAGRDSLSGTQPDLREVDSAETRGLHWIPTTVDATDDVGAYTSLAVDSNGVPHISYYDDTNSNLKYAYLDGENWVTDTVDAKPGVGMWTSLALDSVGDPHISYYDENSGDLRYVYRSGLFWQNDTVDHIGNVGTGTSIALDSNDLPCISYHDEGNGDLRFIRHNGIGWDNYTVDTFLDAGGYTSLALDSNDDPHISYLLDYGDYWMLGYAHHDGAQWHNETADGTHGVGIFSSIAVDANDRPHISYRDGNPDGFLKYTYHDGAQWNPQRVDSENDVGRYTSIALDSGDNPHISYRDSTGQDLKYAYHDGARWNGEIVDTSGDVGRWSCLALDDNDRAFISYTKGWKDGLKFAFRDIQLPTLDSDNSPAFGTTGDDYTFNISASDNDDVSMVTVKWEHGLRGSNTSMSRSDGFWTATVRMGDIVDPLNYTIFVRDTAENTFKSSLVQREVRDNDPPQLLDDDSPVLSTTGGRFRFNVSVIDNVEVGGVNISWSHGVLGDNLSLSPRHDFWEGNITLDNNSNSPLSYVIWMADTSGQLSNTSVANVNIIDNDDPVFVELGEERSPTTGDPFDVEVTVMDNVGVSTVDMKYRFDDGEQKEVEMTPMTRGEDEGWNVTVAVPDDARVLDTLFTITDGKGNHITTGWFPLEVLDDDAPEMLQDNAAPFATTGDGFQMSAEFTDNIAVTGVNVSYSFDNLSFEKAGMDPVSGNKWSATVNVTSDASELVYSYIATDSAGNVHEGTVHSIPVKDNDPPVSSAGPDAEFEEGDTVKLDGSGSSDNVGIVDHTWSFIYDEVREDKKGVSMSCDFDIAGTYNVSLTVEDGEGLTSVDHVVIRVRDVTDPVLWVEVDGEAVESGVRFEVAAGAPIIFDASASSDNVGIVSYNWSFIDNGQPKNLQGMTKTYKFLTPGLYTITLTVTDDDGNSESITFDVSVQTQEEETSWGLVIGIIIFVVILFAAVLVIVLVMKRKGKEGRGEAEYEYKDIPPPMPEMLPVPPQPLAETGVEPAWSSHQQAAYPASYPEQGAYPDYPPQTEGVTIPAEGTPALAEEPTAPESHPAEYYPTESDPEPGTPAAPDVQAQAIPETRTQETSTEAPDVPALQTQAGAPGIPGQALPPAEAGTQPLQGEKPPPQQ